jgi:hypothetical protein
MFNALSTGYRLTQICQNDDGTGGGFKVVDLSLYTVTREFLFQRPDGTLLAPQAAVLTTDGHDGSIYFDTPAGFFLNGDLTPAYGRWRWRSHVKASASKEFYGDWLLFEVGD